MNPQPRPEQVPASPHLTITILRDGLGRIGDEMVTAATGQDVRAVAIDRAALSARALGRPVRATVSQPLIVRQDGTTAPAPPLPASTAPTHRWRNRGTR